MISRLEQVRACERGSVPRPAKVTAGYRLHFQRFFLAGNAPPAIQTRRTAALASRSYLYLVAYFAPFLLLSAYPFGFCLLPKALPVLPRPRRCFLTSGTIFHGHKLPLQTILAAIAIFVNAAKGISALQLSRDLDVQYKTAWVLLHKIRESLMDYDSSKPFQGIVEMDGVYVNGYIRPKNRLEKRIDRRKAYKPNKRVIISLRQRNEFGIGANRTRTFILRSENPVELSRIASRFIVRGSEVHIDENVGYSNFIAHYNHKVVNHAIEYCGANGENNNQSESYNSRFRRLQYGQCYKPSTLYLSNYANEIAYREDTRRFNNGFIFRDILKKCLDSGISNEFCGYWQGNHRVAERLGV